MSALLPRALVLSIALTLGLPCGAPAAAARPTPGQPDFGARLLAISRELVGVSYQLGGRLQGGRAGGIDCQGLIFYGLERLGPCGWRSYSVMPTRSLQTGELGAPVPGLAPVSLERLDTARVRPGDVLFLLAPMPNPAEPALTALDGSSQWVWHTGLAAEGGSWLHADYTRGVVRVESLAGFMRANGFAGLYALRLSRHRQPPRCRSHAPMSLDPTLVVDPAR